LNKKLLLLGIILTLAEAALVFNMFYPAMSAGQGKGPRKTVPGQGAIKGINTGIYSDQACKNPVKSIHWGILEPGATTSKAFHIRNEGGTNTTLTMALSNWNPVASPEYISMTWNYTGQNIDVNLVPITFTLDIAENIQGITDFSFDITIA
jgi:hypothetical protein